MHNVLVILGRSSLPVQPSPRRPRAVLAAALTLAIASVVLAGCGGDDEPEADASSTPTPTSNVTVPEGVTLTEAGTELDFGESANVAYEPNPERNSVLELTVRGVQQGTVADLSNYVRDDKTKASTPYYVQVGVKNIGTGDVGNSPIPLWAVDSTNTLIQASSFTNSFTKCPSKPLPASFPPNATTTSCLVYLVPDRGTLTGVSYRPLQAVAPIVWTGTVEPPPAPKKKKAS